MRGQGSECLSNKIIRNRMERALHKENARLTSVMSTRDTQWAVLITMTCPLEMQQVADVFNRAGLRATHTKAPPPQLALSYKNPAGYGKISDELYKVLRSQGFKDYCIPMFLRVIRGRQGWHTCSVKVPEKMVQPLLDKGRFVSKVQTFLVHRYLTVPQCKCCLRYGHDTCNEKPSCFRCGSDEHPARECKNT